MELHLIRWWGRVGRELVLFAFQVGFISYLCFTTLERIFSGFVSPFFDITRLLILDALLFVVVLLSYRGFPTGNIDSSGRHIVGWVLIAAMLTGILLWWNTRWFGTPSVLIGFFSASFVGFYLLAEIDDVE